MAAPMSFQMPGHQVGGSATPGPHNQLERGNPPASCTMGSCWGSPRYPGMLCCHGTGEPLVLWDATQLVARDHQLPAKHPPSLRTIRVRLLFLQAASLSCGPQAARQEAAVLPPPLAQSSIAGNSRQHPCLRPDSVGCWLWPHSPQLSNRQGPSGPQTAPTHSKAAGQGCLPPCRVQSCT